MLPIFLPGNEYFNDATNQFLTVEGRIIHLEHSLFAISKWESKWKKSFINTRELTREELVEYIQCMTIEEDVNPLLYLGLTNEIEETVVAYINSKQTATTFSGQKEKPSRKVITAEQIYCWMFNLNIPLECEHWNFDKLTTLIRVCSVENQPQKKMSKRESARYQRDLNLKRRAQSKKKGR